MRIAAAAALLLAAACRDAAPDAPPAPAPPPHVETFAEPHPTPDTYDVGRFELAASCLVFRADNGELFTPILPPGTRLVRAGIGHALLTPDTGRIALGVPVQVKGGRGAYGDPGARPDGCPPEVFMVGAIALAP